MGSRLFRAACLGLTLGLLGAANPLAGTAATYGSHVGRATTSSWVSRMPLPAPIDGLAAVTALNGLIVTFGGAAVGTDWVRFSDTRPR